MKKTDNEIADEPVWDVTFAPKASRQAKKLPPAVTETLARLVKEMEKTGPIQKTWPHFSSLEKSKLVPAKAYHCHIKSGRPTYVACWRVENKKVQIIEVFYVGTHENAPY